MDRGMYRGQIAVDVLSNCLLSSSQEPSKCLLLFHIEVSLFRNRAKKGSMTTFNLAFLLLKTIFDCTSRILLFTTFMFVVNNGQFSTLMTVKAYYTTVLVIMIFNIVINDNETYCSARTWIGGFKTDISNNYASFIFL